MLIHPNICSFLHPVFFWGEGVRYIPSIDLSIVFLASPPLSIPQPAPGSPHFSSPRHLGVGFGSADGYLLPYLAKLAPGDLIQHAPINSDDLPVNVRIPRQKQHRLRHLLVAARPAGRHIALLLDLRLRQFALLPLVRAAGRQLAREIPGCDAVDADLGFLELGAHQFAQVDRGALGRVVAEVALRVPHQAAHAGYHNHRRRPRWEWAWVAGALQ